MARWIRRRAAHGDRARRVLPGMLLAAFRHPLPLGHDEHCRAGAADGADLRREGLAVRTPGEHHRRGCARRLWRAGGVRTDLAADSGDDGVASASAALPVRCSHTAGGHVLAAEPAAEAAEAGIEHALGDVDLIEEVARLWLERGANSDAPAEIGMTLEPLVHGEPATGLACGCAMRAKSANWLMMRSSS